MNTAMAAPNDWPLFQHDLNDDGSSSSFVPTMSEFQVLMSSVATTAVTTAAMPVPQTGSTLSSVSGPHLNPEGRVSKPSARRRSRASRRTPTTLFNTDTTNFRAMVQQFTGGPSSPFSLGGPTVARQANLNPGSAVMSPVSGYQLQYPLAQSQQYAFSVSGGGLMGNSGDVNLGQRGGVGGVATSSRADVEGFIGERVPNSRTSSSGGGNENRSNVFMY